MSGRYHRAKQRTVNALRDLFDRWVRGRCCAAPDYMAGGYTFWRCGRPRGHKGPHRTVNYLWGDDLGGTAYSPTADPIRGLDRYPIDTRRQRRQRRAFHDAADARRARGASNA